MHAVVADRRPLTTPGKIDEIPSGDRLQVEGIVRAAAGDLTFTDPVTGTKTLAELAAGGTATIGGNVGSVDNRLVRSLGTGGFTIDASPNVSLSDAGNLSGLGTISSGAITSTGASSFGTIASGNVAVTGSITATTTIAATGAVTGSNLSGTNTGDQTITLTGDVAGSGTGSFAATIANDAVTYAKMQNASAASILLGRGAGAGAGDLQEITLGTNLSMAGSVLNAATGGSGEANTASNLGATGTGLFSGKVGVDLQFFKIDGVNGLSESVISNVMTLDAALLLPRDGSRSMTGTLDMATQVVKAQGYLSINDTIAAQQNNYTPTGWDTADKLRLTLTGAQTITGFVAPTSAGTTRKAIVNIDSADALTIANESASSTAANRIACPGGVDLVVPFGGAAIIDYDATSSRWRPFAVARVNRTGPASSTDNAIVRWDGTTGNIDQNSVVTIDDTGNVNIPSGQTLQLNTSVIAGLGYTVISPTAIASQQNDYSPTSWSGADIVRLTFTGSQTITGFSATATAVRKVIVNADSADTLTLAHESASSTAANRISCPNGVNLVIPFGGSVTIIYDATTARWRPIEVNNGAIAAPPAILHSIRRSAQLTNITSTIFPAYDTVLSTINTTYWSFSGGSWTCNKAHRSAILTRMSYQVNSGAVSARAGCDIVQGTGGSYTNNLQTHRDSAYSTTDNEGHLTNYAVRDWAVNDQFRIYYYTNAGAMDILAAMNDCTILWIADL